MLYTKVRNGKWRGERFMAKCEICEEEYSNKRAELGYDTCLKCGEIDAREETNKKKMRIATPYNKGPYMYICSKKELIGMGKKEIK